MNEEESFGTEARCFRQRQDCVRDIRHAALAGSEAAVERGNVAKVHIDF